LYCPAAPAITSIGSITPLFVPNSIYSKLDKWSMARALFLAFITTLGGVDAYRYIYVWSQTPSVADAFETSKADIGRFLNTLEPSTPSFLAIDPDDTDAGVPYRNSDGSELPLPVGAKVALFESGDIRRQHLFLRTLRRR
jgi:hypothetical protein